MVSSGPPKGMMGNSDSVCSMAHAAGGLFGRGRGYGVRSTGAWEVTGSTCVWGGGGGCALTYQSVNGGKGCWRVLAHTPYKRTQPPPPGDREREHRRETKGKQKAKRQETKRKPRQALDTAETHASVVSASTDGLINRREHQQFFYIQHTNLIHKDKHVKHKQNKSSENDDTSDVSERRWRSKCDRTTCQILPLGS